MATPGAALPPPPPTKTGRPQLQGGARSRRPLGNQATSNLNGSFVGKWKLRFWGHELSIAHCPRMME
eukprot:11216184-Lingulodinium_polyedra.AAC.1